MFLDAFTSRFHVAPQALRPWTLLLQCRTLWTRVENVSMRCKTPSRRRSCCGVVEAARMLHSLLEHPEHVTLVQNSSTDTNTTSGRLESWNLMAWSGPAQRRLMGLEPRPPQSPKRPGCLDGQPFSPPCVASSMQTMFPSLSW